MQLPIGARATARPAVSRRMLRYHVFVHSLAERILTHIRRQELLKAGDRVGVAVSGGIDSVALLRLMIELRGELGIVLSVVHFNHKLRGPESEADEQFVAKLARAHDLEFLCDSDDVAGHAREQGVSLETAARELRYGFFRHLIREGLQGLKPEFEQEPLRGPEGPLFHGTAENISFDGPSSLRSASRSSGDPLRRAEAVRLDKIVTGHTLDDQAETVLMRVIRGAGLRGLGGIHPQIPVEGDEGETCGEIVRPLIGFRRGELEEFLKQIGQTWREDSTNSDTSFTRNRVRSLLIPLLEKEFNPAVAQNLAELAEIARGEEDFWENELAGWMGTGVHWLEPEWARKSGESGLVQISSVEASEILAPGEACREGHPPSQDNLQSRINNAAWLVQNASVDRVWLLSEPIAVQRRVVKAIGEQAGIPLEFKHVEEVLRFAAEQKGGEKEISLPLGWKVEGHPEELLFVTPDLREASSDGDYEYELPVPGRVNVIEAGSTIEAARVPADASAGYNPEQLLDAGSLSGTLRVRNWRAGDRFWPRHTKSPKKIKELLQELHVEHTRRRSWPVVVSSTEIIWMRGFPPPAQFAVKPGREAIIIREAPSGDMAI